MVGIEKHGQVKLGGIRQPSSANSVDKMYSLQKRLRMNTKYLREST
jgi:hypothetical protein